MKNLFSSLEGRAVEKG